MRTIEQVNQEIEQLHQNDRSSIDKINKAQGSTSTTIDNRAEGRRKE